MHKTGKIIFLIIPALLALTAITFAADSQASTAVPIDEDDLGNTEGLDIASAHGTPAWSVSKTSLNVYITDVPLWYTPPFGPAVEIQLSYNSKAATVANAPFGNKWTFNYGSYIKEDANGNAKVFMPDGGKDFYKLISGSYKKPTGVVNTLNKVTGASTVFTLTFLDGSVYTYQVPGVGGLIDYYLSEIKDAYDNTLTIAYAEDANQKLTTMTITPSAAPAQQIVLHYDANGHVQSITDAFNRHADFSYTGNNLFSIRDMGGYVTEFTYDGSSYVTSMTLKPNNGSPTPARTWGFNIKPADGLAPSDLYPAPTTAIMGKNYRVTVTDPAGNKEEHYYDATSGKSWYVSPKDYIEYTVPINNYNNAAKTKYYIDRTTPKARLKKIVYPEGGYTKYSNFDANGKPQSITDYHDDVSGQPVTHSTQYEYNVNGLVTKIIDARGKQTDITYKANNIDVWKITNPLGSIDLDYNSAHDITSIKDRLNNTSTFEYETNGQLKKIIQPLGLTTELVYNPTTRYLTGIKKGGSVISSFTYDTIGRVQTQTGPTGVTTTYEYNNLDKVTKVTFPDAKFIQVNRSALHPHLIDSVTDRNGLVTTYVHNALNQLTEVQGLVEGATNSYIYDYQYDKNGNLWKIIDMKKQPTAATVFEYNKDDLMTKKTYADGKFVTYTYDKMGQPKTSTNARNITTTYTFDGNHNLTNIAYSDATPAVVFQYDDYNRMTKRTDGTGVTDFTYLANDALKTVDGPLANDAITYQYDQLGRLTS